MTEMHEFHKHNEAPMHFGHLLLRALFVCARLQSRVAGSSGISVLVSAISGFISGAAELMYFCHFQLNICVRSQPPSMKPETEDTSERLQKRRRKAGNA